MKPWCLTPAMLAMNKPLAEPEPFAVWQEQRLSHFNQCLTQFIAHCTFPAPRLQKVMAYAVSGQNKRIRPLFIYATGVLVEAPLESLDLAALAVELVHSYSLVHDDLPAMDNATWRRGQLSCFKAFGEDLAILAGDALQTLAFEVLATYPAPVTATQRMAMTAVLSQASGAAGMVSGQVLDIANSQGNSCTEKELAQLYLLKTGALLQACIRLANIAGSLPCDQTQLSTLLHYAENISLGFQIQDDILDLEGQRQDTGKSVGVDQALAKATYPQLIGLESAKQQVQTLFAQALAWLKPFGNQAIYLQHLTEYLVARKN